eukprot:COSAG04_NODE_857_length_9831_cov_4.420880_14_plen_85_part_01
MKQAQNSSYGWSKVRSHCTRREASATILHIIPLRPSTSANPWRDRHTRPRFAANWPTEMRRLKQLEDENGKLRKLVADLSLDKEM